MSLSLTHGDVYWRENRTSRGKGQYPIGWRAFTMKTFIFLILVILAISAMIWKMRKSQAEAELARKKALERKRRKQREATMR
jgi:hypothetical protein